MLFGWWILSLGGVVPPFFSTLNIRLYKEQSSWRHDADHSKG